MEKTKQADARPWYKKKRVIFPGIFILTIVIVNLGKNDRNQNFRTESTIEKNRSVKKLDQTKFKILTTNHYPAAENFHILLKPQAFTQDSLQNFINRFRNEFCTKECNINLYDDKSIKSLVTKYPLTDKEYLKLADHCIAYSEFEMTEVLFYPYRDAQYKRLGGKKWKKVSIK